MQRGLSAIAEVLVFPALITTGRDEYQTDVSIPSSSRGGAALRYLSHRPSRVAAMPSRSRLRASTSNQLR